MNLPEPKISKVYAITISSGVMEKSLLFYQKLGFVETMRFDMPFPWIMVSDGGIQIMLKQDPVPYISLTYYVEKIEEIATELEKGGIVFITRPIASDMIKRFVFQSPDGLNIALVSNIDNFFTKPTGQTMLSLPQQDYFNPEKYPNKICGLFGEFAHPVSDLDASISFWNILGFTLVSIFKSPYPWAIITDGVAIIGLHQTSNFSQPAITYFAADMKSKIVDLIASGLDNYEDKGGLSNIIVKTPEGQQIFLYKLGM